MVEFLKVLGNRLVLVAMEIALVCVVTWIVVLVDRFLNQTKALGFGKTFEIFTSRLLVWGLITIALPPVNWNGSFEGFLVSWVGLMAISYLTYQLIVKVITHRKEKRV